jgi:hypothetical protein
LIGHAGFSSLVDAVADRPYELLGFGGGASVKRTPPRAFESRDASTNCTITASGGTFKF